MDVYLDPERPRAIAASLYEQVRGAVASGRLVAGARLPTSRWLSDDLGISRSTVTTVYGRLVAEGVLEARVGDGTYVARQPVTDTQRGGRTAPRRTRRRPAISDARRTSLHDVEPADAVVADLRTGRPDPALFPLTAWRRAVRTALELPPPGYGHPAGLPALRAAIATWIGRSRGLAASADGVLVTAGAQQAFDLCARVLVAPGQVVALEEPGYAPTRRAFVHHGARVTPVPVDRDGLVVDAIDPSARVVTVTPSHQSPTGVTMSVQRRHALLAWAREHDATIVEDDYDTEYRYVDRPLEPLHRLAAHGRVLYVGTFSKTLSPSLRLGFVVASTDLVDELTEVRRSTDVQPPHVTQAALANLIVRGDLDRHIRRTRPVFRARHQLVERRIAALHAAGLIAAPWHSNAGLHTMVELLADTGAAGVRDELVAAGVVVETTDDNWLGAPRPALAVGYGLADEHQLERAFDLLTSTLTRHRRRPR